MNIDMDIKETETKLFEIKQKREELIKLAKEEEERLEAELQRQKLANWTPTQESVRAALKETRDFIGYGGKVYKCSIKEILHEQEKSSLYNENYTFAHVETCGGGEGDGEEHWVVFAVEHNKTGEKTHWQVPGYYASYDGGHLEWDNAYQVVPREAKIIVWDKK